jgi:predicted metal-dependent peptidase
MAQDLDREMIEIGRGTLYRRMHLLALPLGMLSFEVRDLPEGLATDGEHLYIDRVWLQNCFDQAGGVGLAAAFFHSLAHCLLGHLFTRGDRDPALWDTACDVAACGLLAEALPDLASFTEDPCWTALLEALGRPRTVLTAEGVYALLTSGGFSETDTLAQLCRVDGHGLWEAAREKEERTRIMATGGDEGEGLAAKWQQAASRAIRGGRGGGERKIGAGTGAIRRAVQLRENKRHNNYREFLKAFTVLRENSRLDMEQFQYAYYLYGLEHYGNMPLIEPLEYREERRLESLVIAIDTSESCSQELTRMFLEETRAIIHDSELFFKKFNLHIMQCDTKVHRDDKICSLREFERYIDDLSITGFGGTDFRPVFERVDELRRSGELIRLRGLLYFTDGYGVYPRQMPDYLAAFVFMKYRYDDIDLPSWALKLVLDAEKPKGAGE